MGLVQLRFDICVIFPDEQQIYKEAKVRPPLFGGMATPREALPVSEMLKTCLFYQDIPHRAPVKKDHLRAGFCLWQVCVCEWGTGLSNPVVDESSTQLCILVALKVGALLLSQVGSICEVFCGNEIYIPIIFTFAGMASLLGMGGLLRIVHWETAVALTWVENHGSLS